MEVGQIMKCTDYNHLGLNKWQNDYENSQDHWRKPFLAHYVFTTPNGDYRKYGYVGKYKRGVLWRKTKKEVIEALKKEGVEYYGR